MGGLVTPHELDYSSESLQTTLLVVLMDCSFSRGRRIRVMAGACLEPLRCILLQITNVQRLSPSGFELRVSPRLQPSSLKLIFSPTAETPAFIDLLYLHAWFRHDLLSYRSSMICVLCR